MDTLLELPDVLSKRRELLVALPICEMGTDVDEAEFLTVLLFDSDSANSFLTASGE
jgi:hypothetical protein